MRFAKKLLVFVPFVITSLNASHPMAATDGTLGITSTGTAVITLVIPQLYRISGIGDFAFGTYSGSGSMTANDDICVYSNSSNSYKIRITDNTNMTANTFAVENTENTHQVPMELRWNSTTGTAGNVAIAYNTPLTANGANAVSSDCSSGGLSSNLQINFAQADLQSSFATAYSSTLTLLIEP